MFKTLPKKIFDGPSPIISRSLTTKQDNFKKPNLFKNKPVVQSPMDDLPNMSVISNSPQKSYSLHEAPKKAKISETAVN